MVINDITSDNTNPGNTIELADIRTELQDLDTDIPIENGRSIERSKNILEKCFDSLIIASCCPVTNKLSNKIIIFFIFSVTSWLVTYILVGNICGFVV